MSDSNRTDGVIFLVINKIVYDLKKIYANFYAKWVHWVKVTWKFGQKTEDWFENMFIHGQKII